MTTWMITGCSKGLGRALAEQVLKMGSNVVVTARDMASVKDLVTQYPQSALAVSLDVTDAAQIIAAVTATRERFGGIDVLVNNAGHGYRGAIEEGDPSDVAELFATNFFGPVALLKVVLPEMRARRKGAIVNVSSIAGRGSQPGSGYYSATKSALETMSDALRKEVGPLGIKVMVVEPGAFRTDFNGESLQQTSTIIRDYADTAGRRRKENDTSHGRQPGDPVLGAATIINVLALPQSPFRLLLGSDAVAFIRAELQEQVREIDEWQEVSVSTDFS